MMRKRGFTLIELVMVIVIIGILAAVAIPKFMDLQKEAQKARCLADVGAIRTGITGWYAKYNVNGTRCPSRDLGAADNTSCNATSGFPTQTELNTQNGYFAKFAFTEGVLPDTSHITNVTARATGWGAIYNESVGSLNDTATCPTPP